MKKSNWIIFFVNGLIAILFSLLLLFVPESTILGVVRIFGIILLLSGLIIFYSSFKNMKAKKSYLLLMIEGIFAILIGAVIAINPGNSLNIFLILVGIWAVAMGLVQIIVAVQMRKKVSNHSLFTINGVITLVFGLLLFYNPMGTAKALLTVIGILALAAGVLLVYLAFKVRAMVESR
jgi:uncharacterized membrane protein HdeD (DUF308 family)